MLDFIRGLVRPVVTGLMAGAVVYFTAIKVMPIEGFVAIATTAIVWFYKDRSDKKKV